MESQVPPWVLRHLVIDFFNPWKFSPKEKRLIRDSASKTDDFLDREFGHLEGSGFSRADVGRVNVFFWRLGEEEVHEMIPPDSLMQVTPSVTEEGTFEEDSFVVYVRPEEVDDPATVMHELAHAVRMSFCEPYGVNRGLRAHFLRLEESVRGRAPPAFRQQYADVGGEEFFCELVPFLILELKG